MFNSFFSRQPNLKSQKWDFDYIGQEADQVVKNMGSSFSGLSEEEAQDRLKEYGLNEPAKKHRRTILIQILSKFGNPLVVVLLIIAAFSMYFGEKISAFLVSMMAFLSVAMSFVQEYRAGKEAEKLSEMVHTTATVVRNGQSREIKIQNLVPGDVVDLFAGDMIPADLRIISGKDLFVNQASLTGEAFPIEKFPPPVNPLNKTISELSNIAFMGSSVVSGTALGVVIKTGIATQFGELSRRLATMRIETSFDKGVKTFTWLMIKVMLVLIVVIFAINAILRKNYIEALLFSLGVAVGLTPEMLPMIVTMNLSKGAINMSKKKVIVKRLNSIQNFGAMDILCTDKTGTLTMDKIVLERHCDVVRKDNDEVLKLALSKQLLSDGA